MCKDRIISFAHQSRKMNRKIKLIWDFRGPSAQKTAEHHAIHLKEYSTLEKIDSYGIDTNRISNGYAIAYMIVDEKDMITVRDALRPHRAAISNSN